MFRRAALATLASILLAACGGGATPGPASPAPASVAATAAASASGGASSSAGPTTMPGAFAITTAESEHGTILVDGDGMTLYVFLNDTAGQSTCYDQCAANWPPAIADGPVQPGGGLAPGDFGTTVRTEGGDQATFHGRPLYYYARDEAPGDTNGQGIGQVWYVVGPDGQPIE